MEAHRKFHIRRDTARGKKTYMNKRSLSNKESDNLARYDKEPSSGVAARSESKQKQSDKIESQYQEFLANGGKVEQLASSLDNDIAIKVRHGEGRPI